MYAMRSGEKPQCATVLLGHALGEIETLSSN
jgi:hypothetical protein